MARAEGDPGTFTSLVSSGRRIPAVSALLILLTGGLLAGPPGARAQTIYPNLLAGRASTLIDGTAEEWAAHELSDGQLIDPVLGATAESYGQGMTGQAMVEVGASSPQRQALVEEGLQAELTEVSDPDGGGFELLSLSEDFSWDQQHLSGDPSWQAAEPQIAAFLSTHGELVSDAGVCYTTSNCYDNLKLVAAVADLSLLHTGLTGSDPSALLARPQPLLSEALSKLAAAAGNTGRDATHSGAVAFTGAGILSDPSQNPLAYHSLSTLMLGHAVLALGAGAPRLLTAAFTRTARALIGLMAPDGDVAYIGRGQGQVWTVAATVDALSLAASMTGNTTWRGRFLAGAQLALRRLETLYPRSGWGLPVVPRLARVTGAVNYLGIDSYANSVEYNGLTLWALRDAVATLSRISPTPSQPLPSQTQGTFLDPSHTRFSTVTHGRLWFAVHATDSNLSDARYGFGLVSAELYNGSQWAPVLPVRPLTSQPQVGGIVIHLRGLTRYPIGESLTSTSSGLIHIDGRWSPAAGLKSPRASWLFAPTPTGHGVLMSFTAPPGASFQFQVWFQDGSLVLIRHNGLHVREPDGVSQTYTLSAPVTVHSSPIAHSAYLEDLSSAIITLPASSHRRTITYTTLL